MQFFAIQVRTGEEERFLALAKKKGQSFDCQLLWPRRSLRIRRAGVWKDSLAPVFPGYLFVKAEKIDSRVYSWLRKTRGFLRFLLNNETIVPLSAKDQELLMHFLAFGEIVDKSIVRFDENHRIRVLSGPLKGLEGKIVKVDKRKGRAKVKLDLYKDSFAVDLGFQVLEDAQGPEGSPPPAAPQEE